MTIIQFVLLCVVLGVALWLINTFIPMEPAIKKVMTIGVVVFLVVLIIFAVFGNSVGDIGNIRIGR